MNAIVKGRRAVAHDFTGPGPHRPEPFHSVLTGVAVPRRFEPRSDSLLVDQDDQLPASGDVGVQQIPLEHGVVLGHDRNDGRRVFRALAFEDGHSKGRNEGIEFAKPVVDGSAVEADGQFASSKIDVVDVAMSPLEPHYRSRFRSA